MTRTSTMPGRLLHFIGRRPSESTTTAADASPLHFKTHHTNSFNSLTDNFVRDVQRVGSMDKVKRMSITAKLADKEKHDKKNAKSPKVAPHQPANLNLLVESPPLVFHGAEAESSGALFSAQLQLYVFDQSVTFESYTAKIEAICTVEKPVTKDCPSCAHEILNLKEMDFAKEPLVLKQGMHEFPISHLFKGHLPASTDSPLVKFDYVLAASAVTSTGEKLNFRHIINIKRAVGERDDHTSSRTFPPTDFLLHCTYNRNIYPIGELPFHFRLENLTKKYPKDNYQIQFRMTSFVWRLEERHKMVSPPCSKHAHKHGEGKGVLNQELRILASDTMTKGWKSDVSAGTIEWELPIAAKKRAHCDVTADNGISITHSLVVDMVLREERAPIGRPDQGTPTGLAKQCKTQFHVLMTERAGMGISWDEEMPPTYQDVPPSPPHYPTANISPSLEPTRGETSDLILGQSTSSPMIRPTTGPGLHAGESSTAALRSSPLVQAPVLVNVTASPAFRSLDSFTEDDLL